MNKSNRSHISSLSMTPPQFKIFIGMYDGVGKTFGLLQYALELKKRNKKVIIGQIQNFQNFQKSQDDQSKQNSELSDLIKEFDFIPLLHHTGENVESGDLNIEEIILQKPFAVIIDQLAFSNSSKSKHKKRYQDVEELLAHGISVLTSLNISQIESLSDTVYEILNDKNIEKVPDIIIDKATDIILIDQSPSQYLERYQSKNSRMGVSEEEQNQNKHFELSISKLTALRELSLRYLADKVDGELKILKVVHGVPQIWKTTHKIMVCVYHSEKSEKLIRWTRRFAANLNASWVGLHVDMGNKVSDEDLAQLSNNLKLVKQLGGEVVTIMDSDEVQGVLKAAKQHQITQIILGHPSLFNLFSFKFFRNHFIKKLFDECDDIDFYVVGTKKSGELNSTKSSLFSSNFFYSFRKINKNDFKNLLFFLLFSFLITLVLFPFKEKIGYRSICFIYLIFINISSIYLSGFTILISTISSVLLWYYFILPPHFSFSIRQKEDFFLIVIFFVSALIIGLLSYKTKYNEYFLKKKEEKIMALYYLSQKLLNLKCIEDVVSMITNKINEYLNCHSVVFIKKNNEKDFRQDLIKDTEVSENELKIANYVFQNGQRAGKFTSTYTSALGSYYPLKTSNDTIIGVLGIYPGHLKSFTFEQEQLVEFMVKQLTTSIEKEFLYEKMKMVEVFEESEKMYNSLLSSVSKELRDPLLDIEGKAASMLKKSVNENEEAITSKSMQIISSAKKMNYLIQNLLDMSRIDAGQLKLRKKSIVLNELLQSVLEDINCYYSQKKIYTHLVNEEIKLFLDEKLIKKSLYNIIQNSCIYSYENSSIDIFVKISNESENDSKGKVIISILDNGPGLPEPEEMIFQKFYRNKKVVSEEVSSGGTGIGLTISKAIIELHDGSIYAMNRKNNLGENEGTKIIITLPLSN